MSIILKFTLQSIKENKFRTFLIIFSIIVSTALFFSSSSITDTITKMYLEKLEKTFGSSDIIMQSGRNLDSKFFSPNIVKSYEGTLIDKTLGIIDSYGSYKIKDNGLTVDNQNIMLTGTSYDEQQSINPIKFLNEFQVAPFSGKKIILSNKTAEKYNFHVGDTIELEIEGNNYKLNVVGIAVPQGPFTDDGQTHNAIVPKEFLEKVYGQKGSVTTLYIKTINPDKKQAVIDTLKESFKKYNIKDTISKAELEEQTAGIQSNLMIAVLIVLFMSVFIIYTAAKVITMERLPVIGTFRSIGATKRTTNMILLVENIAYGFVGGFIGILIGIIVLFILAYSIKPPWGGEYDTSINFTISQVVFSYLLAVLLPFFSSLIPILKVSKISLKDIILNTIVTKQKPRSKIRGIISLILMIIAILSTFLCGSDEAVNSLSILLVIISNIMLVPYYTSIFLFIFKNIYIHIFGNEGVLAVKNLNENKSIMNNISMLVIGISSLLMINITSFHTLNDIVNFFEKSLHYDLYLYSSSFNKTVEPSVRKIDGIEDVMGVYSAKGVELKGKDQNIGTLEGVDINKIQDFMSIEFMQGDTNTILSELESGRNIIMCNMLKSTLGVKLGDTITLKLGDKYRDYKIVGFLNSMMMGGNYAIVSERFFKQDVEPQSFDYFAVKTSQEPDSVLSLAKNKLIRKKASGLTVKETMLMVKRQNQQIFTMLNGFTFMTIVISIFGVLNNLIISFIERRRTFAILRSVGMSKFQVLKMVFIEAFTSGVIGGVVGVVTGFVMIWITSLLMKQYAINIPLTLPLNMVIIALFSAILITVSASISPGLKTSKLNIIEMLKCE